MNLVALTGRSATGRNLDGKDVLDIFNLSKSFGIDWGGSCVPVPVATPVVTPVPTPEPLAAPIAPLMAEALVPGRYADASFRTDVDQTIYKDILSTPSMSQSVIPPQAPNAPTRVSAIPLQTPVPVCPGMVTRAQSCQGVELSLPLKSGRGCVVKEADFFALTYLIEVNDEVICAAMELTLFHDVEMSSDKFDGCLARVLDDPDWPENDAPDQLPKTYCEAMRHPTMAKFYNAACNEQYAALLAHKIWVLVPLPTGRVAICGHWDVAAKVNLATNWVTGIKSCWVADGNMRKEGIDYKETFSSDPKSCYGLPGSGNCGSLRSLSPAS